MTYRGIINLDFSKFDDGTSVNGNEQNRLSLALIEAGWRRVETSAYAIDAADLSKLWCGIELVAKQTASVGKLSALTYHVQLIRDLPNEGRPTCTLSGPAAIDDIRKKPYPG